MPIYEYECERCGGKFELFRRFGDEEHKIECPKCQAENPKRVISRVAECPSGDSCSTTESCATIST